MSAHSESSALRGLLKVVKGQLRKTCPGRTRPEKQKRPQQQHQKQTTWARKPPPPYNEILYVDQETQITDADLGQVIFRRLSRKNHTINGQRYQIEELQKKLSEKREVEDKLFECLDDLHWFATTRGEQLDEKNQVIRELKKELWDATKRLQEKEALEKPLARAHTV